MSGIDLHTHLAPVLPDLSQLAGLERGDDQRFIVDGHRVGLPDLYDPRALDAWLRRTGLDEAVVSIPPPFFRQQLAAPAAAAWVEAANEGLVAATHDLPRLSRLAYLPLEHPGVALREYERVCAQGGWAGVVASAGGRSAPLSDQELEPLWSRLDADARLLMLHPGSSPDVRLDAFYLSNLLGNPVETALAAAQLIFGDVLTQWARMRVLLVHCGGCVPGLIGRWERGAQTRRPGVPSLTESPRQAARRLFADCLAHDAGALDQAVRTFGEDKIVLGSDWPFPMGIEDPRTLVEHRGRAFVERVATTNARAALDR